MARVNCKNTRYFPEDNTRSFDLEGDSPIGSGDPHGISLFTDATKYSYAALCSLALKQLYLQDDYHHQFAKALICNIRKHLDLPEHTDEVMVALFHGEGDQTEDVYVERVKQEGNSSSILIVRDLVYLAVKGGKYDARTRALILALSKSLDVGTIFVDIVEESAFKFLTGECVPKTENEEKESKKRQRNIKMKRYGLVGLATLGGGAILGLTGGLAAPFIGAGFASVFGGAAAVAIGSTTGAAVIGSLFGAAGAGLSGFKMKRRVGGVEEFEFRPLNQVSSNSKQNLHIVIAVSGWLNDDTGKKGFWIPWKHLKISQEQYCLMYESKYLLELGRNMDYLFSVAVSLATQEALKLTVLSGLIAAIAWPISLVAVASVLDNPWGVCCRRSAQIGKTLADVLLSREYGNRPVTLIGYSLGARVIFYCLKELSQRNGPEVEGIVLDAIMLGAPVTGKASIWSKLARVVSGNVINGYCATDWLLKLLYRSTAGHYRIAGLEKVTWSHPRMRNVDLSFIVDGHRDYANKIDEILEFLGYGDQNADGPSQLRRTRSAQNVRGEAPNLVRCPSEDSFFLVRSNWIPSSFDLIQKSDTRDSLATSPTTMSSSSSFEGGSQSRRT